MGTHYQGTAEEIRALDTFIKLVRATESASGRIHQHLEQTNLTVSQFGVLEALWHLGSLSQRDLGHKLLKSGGNITLVIDNLEKRQLVRRERQTHDRRVILVCLTELGSTLIQDVFPRQVQAVVQEMSVLTPIEQENLGQLCRRLGKHE